ncbi:MAG: HEAT repeat domain-containing protein [Bryobacteraceae bacterium]|nr:HEAT repeat domain-containing protein [Bryobacteraceae bacterium]
MKGATPLLILTMLTAPSPAGSLPWLLSTADAVVIGTEVDRVKQGALVSFTLNVEHVFKGTIPPGASVHVSWDSGVYDPIWANSRPSCRGIWALQNKEGLWWAVPARAGRVPAFQRLFYPVPARPIASDFQSQPGSTSIDQLLGLIAAAEVERDGMPVLLEAATDYDSAEARRIFRIMARGAQPRARLLGLASLVQRGDVGAIVQLGEGTDRNMVVPGISELVVPAVEVFFRNNDVRGIRALGQLATTPSSIPGLQVGAARALSSIHTRESVPFLASLLESSNPSLVRSAVIGLSFYANGVGVQRASAAMDHLNQRTPTAYTTKDTLRYLGFDEGRSHEYLTFWKQWWSMNQTAFR